MVRIVGNGENGKNGGGKGIVRIVEGRDSEIIREQSRSRKKNSGRGILPRKKTFSRNWKFSQNRGGGFIHKSTLIGSLKSSLQSKNVPSDF